MASAWYAEPMKFPSWLPVFGDATFRGTCPVEVHEQRAFFKALRKSEPRWGAIAVHIRNEQARSVEQTRMWQADGMNAGAVDIIIPTRVPFVCEMKRADHTKSSWAKGQQEYLQAVIDLGGFACVALGARGAWDALGAWSAASGVAPPSPLADLTIKRRRSRKRSGRWIDHEILEDEDRAPYLWI